MARELTLKIRREEETWKTVVQGRGLNGTRKCEDVRAKGEL